MMVYQTYASPCGELLLAADGGTLCLCDWLVSPNHRRFCMQSGTTAEIEKVRRELDLYFSGQLRRFTVPVAARGSDFDHAVWRLLYDIPYGTTCSYSDMACRLGRPTAVRAVAAAIGRNPLSIICPCHRVVGCTGKLAGYAGGLEAKRYLLGLESSVLDAQLFGSFDSESVGT